MLFKELGCGVVVKRHAAAVRIYQTPSIVHSVDFLCVLLVVVAISYVLLASKVLPTLIVLVTRIYRSQLNLFDLVYFY